MYDSVVKGNDVISSKVPYSALSLYKFHPSIDVISEGGSQAKETSPNATEAVRFSGGSGML
jgi:hypothetical protein